MRPDSLDNPSDRVRFPRIPEGTDRENRDSVECVPVIVKQGERQRKLGSGNDQRQTFVECSFGGDCNPASLQSRHRGSRERIAVMRVMGKREEASEMEQEGKRRMCGFT